MAVKSINEIIPRLQETNAGVTATPAVYIDDMFDPLFNKYAREYLRKKYGDSVVLNTLAGYGEGIANAWGNKQGKGILGPTMGVLGYFGRSLDKADDALLGTLIEATDPTGFNNPIEQILVEDRPYEGKELIKNLINQTRKDPNKQIKDEDLKGLLPTLGGLAIDLATDPGILGGTLAKIGSKSTKPILQNLGKVGEAMSDYDNMAAMLAWNAVAPGSTFAASKFLGKLDQLIGGAKSKDVVNVDTNPSKAKTVAETLEPKGPNIPAPVIREELLPQTKKRVVKNAKTVKDGIKKAPKALPAVAAPKDNLTQFVENGVKTVKEAYKPKDVLNPEVAQIADQVAKIEAAPKVTDSVVEPVAKNVPELTTYEDAVKEVQALGSPTTEAQIKNIAKYTEVENIGGRPVIMGIKGVEGGQGMPLTAPSGANVFQNVITPDRIDAALKQIDDDEIRPILEEIKEAGGWERYVEQNWEGSGLDFPEIEALQKKVLNALEESEGSSFRYVKSGGTERFIARPSQYYPLRQYAPVKKYVDSWTAILKNKIETTLGRKVGVKEFRTKVFEAFGWAEKDIDSLLTNYKKAWNYQLKNKTILKEFNRIPKTNKIARNQFIKNLALIDPEMSKAIDFISKYNEPYFFVKGLDDFIKVSFLEEVPSIKRVTKAGKRFEILNTYEAYKASTESFVKTMNSNYAKRILSKGKSLGDDFSRSIVSALDELSDNLTNLNKKIISVTGSGFSSDAFETVSKEIGDILPPNTLVKSFLESIPFAATRALRSGLVEITPEILAAAQKEEAVIRKILEDFPEIEVIDRLTGKKIQTLIKSELDPTKVAAGQVSPLQFAKGNYNPATVPVKITEEKLTQAVNNSLTTPSKELPPIVEGATVPDPIKAVQETLKDTPIEQATNTAIEVAMKVEYPTTPFNLAEAMDAYNTTTKRETLFSRLSKAASSSAEVEAKNYSASLDNPIIREVVAKVNSVKDKEIIKRFIKAQDEAQSYVTRGKTVLSDLLRSRGFKVTVIKDSVQNAALRKQLQKLANLVNENARKMGAKGDILLLNKPNKDGIVGIFLNEGTPGFQNYFTRIVKSEMNGKFLFDEDIVWYNNKGAQAFTDVGRDADILKESYSKGIDELRGHVVKLGHNEDLTASLEKGLPYLHHSTVGNDKLTKKILDTFTFVKANGAEGKLNPEELGKYADSMANYLNLNKKFRSVFLSRSFEGPMSIFKDEELGKLFEDEDLGKIINATLSEGVLANKNYQLYLNLFENDNLRVNQMFNSSKELKAALFAVDPITKSVGGNVNQLDVVIPIYKNGTLTSFKRIDKFSDAALEEAFKNGNAVLLPNTLYAPLDRLLKKDVLLSNKAYLILNKYFTLPFKFGVLTNPAFPIGNLSDAFFKTATELGVKYDRSFLEASIKTTGAMTDVVKLENTVTDIVENYLMNWAKPGEVITPQVLIKDSAARKRFFEYLDAAPSSKFITPAQAEEWKAVMNLYMLINRVQDTKFTQYFTKKMLERVNKVDSEVYNVTQEIAKGLDNVDVISKYNVQTNAFEKIIYGNDKTFGLFFNNPLSKGVMAASSGIENMMRSAHILAILKEEGILENLGTGAMAIKRSIFNDSEKINIALQNAANSMNAAHFNYDDITDLMAGISTVIPFPTFMLKNLGFWLNKAIDNPQIIDNVISVHENLWSDKNKAAQQDEFLGEAKGRGAVPALGSILKPTPYGSLFSAFDTLTNPVPNVAYRLNPMTRLLTQAVLPPAEDVKYRPYTTDIYTKNVKRGDPNFSYMRYALQSLNPFERQIQSALRLPTKIEQGNVQIADVLPSVFQPDFSNKKRRTSSSPPRRVKGDQK